MFRSSVAGKRTCSLVLFVVLSITVAVRAGGEDPNDPAVLTLERMFTSAEFEFESFGPARWLKDGSPITFAKQLEGNLLIVYGTGDDNCHYQNCLALTNELVKHNKYFSMMSYPNRTHAIKEGDNTRRHLYETMTTYLGKNLPADL